MDRGGFGVVVDDDIRRAFIKPMRNMCGDKERGYSYFEWEQFLFGESVEWLRNRLLHRGATFTAKNIAESLEDIGIVESVEAGLDMVPKLVGKCMFYGERLAYYFVLKKGKKDSYWFSNEIVFQ